MNKIFDSVYCNLLQIPLVDRSVNLFPHFTQKSTRSLEIPSRYSLWAGN